VLPPLAPIVRALDQLEALSTSALLASHAGQDVRLTIDLGDARGYRYHSGVIFAAYVEGQPNAIGRGGRYDNVGESFGRARPATGFSVELRELAGLVEEPAPARAVRAPWSVDAALSQAIQSLRDAGQIVVQVLPGHEDEQQEFECDRELAQQNGAWSVRPLRRQ
jgi:ATP phosphoribosyltransferase regulatory subunit